ncbi:hypothetical protein Hanom_Chr10g00885741 [Helianthus anomalus]
MSNKNKEVSKQEFMVKVAKRENSEKREVRPELSSFLRSVLRSYDSCTLERLENLQNLLRISP